MQLPVMDTLKLLAGFWPHTEYLKKKEKKSSAAFIFPGIRFRHHHLPANSGITRPSVGMLAMLSG